MTRFPPNRRRRIAVWTSAAIAWATSLVTWIHGGNAVDSLDATLPTVDTAIASDRTVLPSMPADGLLVLRYTPSNVPEPEIQTVYVRQSPPSSSANTSAPRPSSGGS